MALTAEELQRIVDIETNLAEIQTLLTALASKASVRQLNLANELNLDALNTKVDNLTPSTEAVTIEDLNIFAKKEQLKQLLLLKKTEIDEIQAKLEADISLTALSDTTIQDNPTEKDIISFSSSGKWENKGFSDAGIASIIHNHRLDGLIDVDSQNLIDGYVLQYDLSSDSWIPTAQIAAVGGQEGGISVYDENGQLVSVSLLQWNSTTNSLEIGDVNTDGNIVTTGNIQTNDAIFKGKEVTGIGTAPVVVDTFDKSTYRSAKYFIEARDMVNDEFLSEEIVLIQNGAVVNIAEFSIVFTSASNFMTFSAEIDTGTDMVKLSASGTSSNNTVKIAQIIIAV